jgi:hypothetical protein
VLKIVFRRGVLSNCPKHAPIDNICLDVVTPDQGGLDRISDMMNR